MRRRPARKKKRICVFVPIGLIAVVSIVAVLAFNSYVGEKIRPTLMQLAEYKARSVTLQAIHSAVSRVQREEDLEGQSFASETTDGVQLNTATVNHMRSALLVAVQEEMQNLPLQQYVVPFGSLTGNSLLSGWGPGWKVDLQPEGYVDAWLQEETESLSINTTRYSASFLISVTVNMILDGRTETLTVTDSLPLVSFLYCGEVPSAYAGALD